MLQMLRAKLHGIRVTGCDLNYHGSVTLDAAFCREVGIYPLEFVHIWNKNNGERFSTYVLPGERGSACCILNGAAARLCAKGDSLIITALAFVDRPEEVFAQKPVVLTFDENNALTGRLRYDVRREQDGGFSMAARPEQP